MGYSKHHQTRNNHSAIKRSKGAYKPKPPFRSVEGVESLAWGKLSCHAVWVLMEFYRRFDGYNRFCLTLSYKEVKRRMACGTFSKAIWELIAEY